MKTKMKIRITWMMVMGLLLSCNGSQQEEKPGVNYQTTVVKKVQRTYEYLFPATVLGAHEVKVYPKVGGIITRLDVTDGMMVHRGQVLCIIDSREYLLNVQTAQANVSSALAQQSTAEMQVSSTQQLADKAIVSHYVLQQAQNQLQTARAGVLQAQAQLDIARTNLSYCTVTSPIQGIVQRNDIQQGDMANPAEELFKVSDNSDVRVRFSLTENDLIAAFREGGLKNTAQGVVTKDGRPLQTIMPAPQLRLSDGSTYQQVGRVSTISGLVNQETGTVICEVVFPNPDGLLHSGTSANVVLPFTGDVIAVPQTAAVRFQDQYMFYRVRRDGTVEGVMCEVKPSNDGKEYYVMKGLADGDEIVVSGARKLTNGMKIK